MRSVNEMAIHICRERAGAFLSQQAPTGGFISRGRHRLRRYAGLCRVGKAKRAHHVRV